MESFTEKFRIFYSNIALVQVQAIIVALLASFLAAFTEFYNLQEVYILNVLQSFKRIL